MCDCEFCSTPIMGQVVMFGDAPLHPECHVKLNEEIQENAPLTWTSIDTSHD